MTIDINSLTKSPCIHIINHITEEQSFRQEDVARSLLLSISNDIGQIAYLYAKLHSLKKIYFGGFFIRGHPLTMHTITHAVNFWAKVTPHLIFCHLDQFSFYQFI